MFVTEATALECQDGLQNSKLFQTRELGQSPRNMSAIDGKIAQYSSFFPQQTAKLCMKHSSFGKLVQTLSKKQQDLNIVLAKTNCRISH